MPPSLEYLPYFELKDPRCRSITVRQMLTHTSGMPDVEDYLGISPNSMTVPSTRRAQPPG